MTTAVDKSSASAVNSARSLRRGITPQLLRKRRRRRPSLRLMIGIAPSLILRGAVSGAGGRRGVRHNEAWAAKLRANRNLGDFRAWQDHDARQKVLERGATSRSCPGWWCRPSGEGFRHDRRCWGKSRCARRRLPSHAQVGGRPRCIVRNLQARRYRGRAWSPHPVGGTAEVCHGQDEVMV